MHAATALYKKGTNLNEAGTPKEGHLLFMKAVGAAWEYAQSLTCVGRAWLDTNNIWTTGTERSQAHTGVTTARVFRSVIVQGVCALASARACSHRFCGRCGQKNIHEGSRILSVASCRAWIPSHPNWQSLHKDIIKDNLSVMNWLMMQQMVQASSKHEERRDSKVRRKVGEK